MIRNRVEDAQAARIVRELRKVTSLAKLESFQVSLNLPYLGGVSGTWFPDEEERKAAWELYVELATRIAVVELRPEEGLLREALSSLYTVFESTRGILRSHGPTVAQATNENDGDLSFGYLAVAVLNTVIRPVLAKWHPMLEDYESERPEGTSRLKHERQWEYNKELRDVLEETRGILLQYADTLAQVAEVRSLIIPRHT